MSNFNPSASSSRPDVKISEDASSDKSGTDPEDSSDNFSQADITDYQNYEQVSCQSLLVLCWSELVQEVGHARDLNSCL